MATSASGRIADLQGLRREGQESAQSKGSFARGNGLLLGRQRVLFFLHGKCARMSRDFEVLQFEIEEASVQGLDNRLRNQLMGCMHAHNELTVLNRIFMFGTNAAGDGELADSADSVQMWCLLQVLTGKLYETWVMVIKRFLAARPEDAALTGLRPEHRASLNWLKSYFGDSEAALKQSPLRIIRDKTAFHYDKLNLAEAARCLGLYENRIYLAQHPANSLYYLGSAAVFRAIFAKIADTSSDTRKLAHSERVARGAQISTEDAKHANYHMHLLLYGLIEQLLERAIGKPLASLDQVRIPVQGAPDPDVLKLPTFIDIG
jgi:hypothetical protein